MRFICRRLMAASNVPISWGSAKTHQGETAFLSAADGDNGNLLMAKSARSPGLTP
jgi:hypothetical protein